MAKEVGEILIGAEGCPVMKIALIFLLLILPQPSLAYIDFDGSDDYADMGTMGNMGSTMEGNGYIFAAWFRSSVTNAIMTVTGTFNDGSSMGTQIEVNKQSNRTLSAGRIYAFVRMADGKGEAGAVNTDTGITDGSWHHLIVYVHDDDTPQIFLDGSSQTVTVDFSQATASDANWQYPLTIGGRNNRATIDELCNCDIEEVYIWQGVSGNALSASDVALLASSRVRGIGLQVEPASLIAYWPFDDGPDGTSADGDTILDHSGTGNSGTGNDGAGNDNLTWGAGEIHSYS